MKPKDVTTKNEAEVLQRFSLKTGARKTPKFKINDKVRVSKVKQLFGFDDSHNSWINKNDL